MKAMSTTMKERAEKIQWPNPHIAKLFLDEVKDLRNNKYMAEEAIAMRFEVSIIDFRLLNATANAAWTNWVQEKALKMREEGYSRGQIALHLGYGESTIRRFFVKEGEDEPEDGG